MYVKLQPLDGKKVQRRSQLLLVQISYSGGWGGAELLVLAGIALISGIQD